MISPLVLFQFIVPKALVVTTRAYKKFASQETVQEILNKFSEDIYNASRDQDVRVVSEECINKLSQIEIPQELSVVVSVAQISIEQKTYSEAITSQYDEIRGSHRRIIGGNGTSWCRRLPLHESLSGSRQELCSIRNYVLQIRQHFSSTMEPLDDERSFAVRSSAIGEDSEEMSAAGQMTTFLNLRDFDDILHAIVKCWASQFSVTGTLRTALPELVPKRH